MDAEAWNHRYADAELIWTAEPNRFLVEVAEGLPPGRALDLATGEGRNAVWLAGRGWRVTGVDFSEAGLAKARRLAAERGVDVEWLLADLRGYAPEPEAFDLVLVLYLHLPPAQLAPVLQRATHAVAPGGRLLAVGHDATNLSEGYGGPQDPAILWTPDAVAALLAPLEVVRAERVHRPVTTPDHQSVDAIDALVLARRSTVG